MDKSTHRLSPRYSKPNEVLDFMGMRSKRKDKPTPKHKPLKCVECGNTDNLINKGYGFMYCGECGLVLRNYLWYNEYVMLGDGQVKLDTPLS